jgi:heme/copper-type cytochrome/quinol oxidase subunit 2
MSAHTRPDDRCQNDRTRGHPWLLVLILTTVGILVIRFMSPTVSPDLPAPDPAVIDVTIDMKGFDRDTIRVRAGEPVTIRLTSLDGPFHLDGGGKHQLAIEELGVDIIAPARGSASATFTATEPGTYTFYCDICCGGRANPTMIGALVVEA